jgi:hypothetical protein
MSKEKILEEFKKRFFNNEVSDIDGKTDYYLNEDEANEVNLLDFLSKAIAQTREETIREVEEILEDPFTDYTYEEMFKSTFRRLKELLNKLKK